MTLFGGPAIAKNTQDRAVKARRAKQMDYEYKPGALTFWGLGGIGEK